MRSISPFVLVALACAPLSAQADLPWLKELAGDQELPRTWGIGFDYFTMDQDYDIETLSFDFPGAGLTNPELIDVTNEIQHVDVKADAWLFPFLNVFGLVGFVDGDTAVDLSQAGVTGFPFPIGTLDVSYDGPVYGAGFTLAWANERFFASATTSYTNADIEADEGDFDSSVKTLSIQPRVGTFWNDWAFYVGGMYLDAEEEHDGAFDFGIPGVPPVPFETTLEAADKWNYAVGAYYAFSEHMEVSLEIGFGNRTHTLLNWTWRP